MPNIFSTLKHTKHCLAPELLIVKTSAEAQKIANMILYSHTKNEILTQTNRLVMCLTYFLRLLSSASHLVMLMSCDVMGGGPTFALIDEVSVPKLL